MAKQCRERIDGRMRYGYYCGHYLTPASPHGRDTDSMAMVHYESTISGWSVMAEGNVRLTENERKYFNNHRLVDSGIVDAIGRVLTSQMPRGTKNEIMKSHWDWSFLATTNNSPSKDVDLALDMYDRYSIIRDIALQWREPVYFPQAFLMLNGEIVDFQPRPEDQFIRRVSLKHGIGLSSALGRILSNRGERGLPQWAIKRKGSALGLLQSQMGDSVVRDGMYEFIWNEDDLTVARLYLMGENIDKEYDLRPLNVISLASTVYDLEKSLG